MTSTCQRCGAGFRGERLLGQHARWLIWVIVTATIVLIIDVCEIWKALAKEQDMRHFSWSFASMLHMLFVFAVVYTAELTLGSPVANEFQSKYVDVDSECADDDTSDSEGALNKSITVLHTHCVSPWLSPFALLWPLSGVHLSASWWLVPRACMIMGYIAFLLPTLDLLISVLSRPYYLCNAAIEKFRNRLTTDDVPTDWDVMLIELYELWRGVNKLWSFWEAGGPWWACVTFSVLAMCSAAYTVIANGLGHKHVDEGEILIGAVFFFGSAFVCAVPLYLISQLTSKMSDTDPNSDSLVAEALQRCQRLSQRRHFEDQTHIVMMSGESRRHLAMAMAHSRFVSHLAMFADNAGVHLFGVRITPTFVVRSFVAVAGVLPTAYSIFERGVHLYDHAQ